SAYFGEQDNELLRILRSSRTAVILIAIMATFTAPIVEELIYRGILYSAFQRTFGVKLAVILVTLAFALVHVPQYWGDFVSISMICLLSLILTLVRVKTDNLLPCIVLHFVFNGIQSLVLILEPYFSKTPQ
ncbi:MAG: CPBP family intramembrane glutamic endopeptidase, partial [Pyrinomonadaceae bacterium]